MLSILTLFFAFVAVSQTLASEPATPNADPAASSNAFVLVEIFSSEGCSSCPKADAYVNSLVRHARTRNLPILLLAWHVDYWDKLTTPHGSWADPHSSPESTKRQKRYAKAVPATGFMAGKLVTPQILIDGRHPTQLSKSNATVIVKERLKLARNVSVTLTRTETGVDWSVKNVEEGCELLIALVQRGIKQHIDRGENHGLDLEHENVVRWHTIVTLAQDQTTGKTKIELPDKVPADSADIIAVVQKSNDMEVLAATTLPCNSVK